MNEELRHGVDLVEVARIRRIIEENPAFEQGVFTADEIAYCRRHADPWPHFAARFAAKEAVLKALKRGLVTTGPDDALKAIEVIRTDGAPRLRLYGPVAKMARALRLGQPEVSLTHAGDFALASVVWPSAPEEAR